MFTALFVLSITSPSATSDELDLKKLEKIKWRIAESQNFTVITDASEKEALGYIQELENFRYFVHFYLQQNEVERLPRANFLLVKRDKAFKYLSLDQESVGGMFFLRGDKVFSIARSGDFRKGAMVPSYERNIVLHELVHYLTSESRRKHKQPYWYYEGIADYLSTFKEDGKKMSIGEIGALKYRFYSLEKRGGDGYESVDLESLFKVERNEHPVENRNKELDKEVSKFYARSFVAVHYFASNPERDKQLTQYLRLIAMGEEVDKAFSMAFNTSYEVLTKEVDTYLSGNYLYGYSFPKSAIQFPQVSIETDPLEKRLAMEWILYFVESRPGLESDDPQLVRARAYLESMKE
ncbi:hypothetical protein [Teredinibacter sp. KSP-S5-2]|uniref:hypothetical protein n=1 Tax=Teredinibacter sp. KSP-S5-2 TaxID=3034506 RepID=UPI002934F28B|nr:hypothetical protein [Teredinibacter sp. KSP-S5-2]WNO08549.1 hypothetical protein P5V12_16375 [Teredinibacter sp. KSP-S5-2]